MNWGLQQSAKAINSNNRSFQSFAFFKTPLRANFDLAMHTKSIRTAKRSILKLAKLQNLAAKCCKMRKI